MSGNRRGDYPPSRGRGISRGRGVWKQREDSNSRSFQSATRPYRRSSSGRGFTQPRHSASGSGPGSYKDLEASREKTKASQQVLARAAAIRESASKYAEDGGGGGDPSDTSSDEEATEGRDLVKKMLKMYYQDLGSDGTHSPNPLCWFDVVCYRSH